MSGLSSGHRSNWFVYGTGDWDEHFKGRRLTEVSRRHGSYRMDDHRGPRLADMLVITYSGRTQTARSWALELDIPHRTLVRRILLRGWDVSRAMEEPLVPTRRHIDVPIRWTLDDDPTPAQWREARECAAGLREQFHRHVSGSA